MASKNQMPSNAVTGSGFPAEPPHAIDQLQAAAHAIAAAKAGVAHDNDERMPLVLDQCACGFDALWQLPVIGWSRRAASG